MGTPSKDFRENYDRAVYISGKINQELVDKLTPQINRLRLASADPITAYIDSYGGSVALAETIRSLIKAPNPDGFSCRLITVVTGTAASAAADFLTLGDYAIVYPHAEILYHGTRQSIPSALTSEGAASLASNLQQTNEFFAVRLARNAFPRFVLRVSQFTSEFRQFRHDENLQLLLTPLRKHFSVPNMALIREAARKQKVIADLSASVARHLKKFKNPEKLSDSRFEGEIFKAILNYKLRLHTRETWLLSDKGLTEISNDFGLLHDFHFGSQKRDLSRFLNLYGELCLSEEQTKACKSLTVDAEKNKAVEKYATSKLRPLWYFMVSLARLLQTDDYRLQPEEAYWLGLVDEVPGTTLPNLRQAVEKLNDQTESP